MTRKLYLSDASIKRAPLAKEPKGYRIADSELPGFFLHVGAPDEDGQAFKTLRLQLEVEGKTRGFSWAWQTPGRNDPTFSAEEARAKAQELRRRRDRGEPLDGSAEGV